MTAKECIKGRRSIRKFKEEAVSHDLIAEIVETASYAPSWKHTQIVRYIAVEGEKKAQLSQCTSAYPHNGEIIAQAPMCMVVTIIKNRSGFERDGSYSTHRGEGWQMYDAGVASEALCLAAYEKGLGTVIMGIIDDDRIAEILEVPADREVIALIPIGYPDEEPTAPRRKPVEELLSFQ